jgi:hypothetical protein
LLVSKHNRDVPHWFELRFRLVGEGKPHYAAVIEVLDFELLRRLDTVKVGVENSSPQSDVTMLIDIPQDMETPQMGEYVGWPTIIWLKAFYDGNGLDGDLLGGFSDSTLSVITVNSPDREIDTPRKFRGCIQQSQLPCQMIEGGAQARYKISGNESEVQRRLITAEGNDILRGLKIIVGRDSIGLGVDEPLNVSLESIEVFLRPVRFHVGVFEARHFHSLALKTQTATRIMRP